MLLILALSYALGIVCGFYLDVCGCSEQKGELTRDFGRAFDSLISWAPVRVIRLKFSGVVRAKFCCSPSVRRCCTTPDNAGKYIGCLTT